ncbi:hypothetical protein C0992_012157 [Termitomyces sp. T32_za158]|nr:hypothetical protein C0992_012157 [Termitomyces sp. T32_za158]
MVQLVLSSTKGNQGLKYFPHVGYLGLTPVRVEGGQSFSTRAQSPSHPSPVVRTRVDADPRQLLAKSITVSVRCYESRLGRVSVLHSNVLVDYTQVLWSKPDGEEYAPIDELEFPFRITVPARVGGFSTSIFVDYRCMWRVEAVLNHAPITAVGSRQVKHFELPLVRFDVPWCQPSPSPAKPLLFHQTTKPKAPRIRYSIDAPTFPIGPLDVVSIPMHLMPLDHSVTIRSATVMIERRIQLNEIYPPPYIDILSSPLPIPSSASRVSPGSSSSSKESTPSSSYLEPSPTAFSGLETVSSDISSDPTVTPHSLYQSSTSLASDRPLLSHASSAAPITSSSSSTIPSKMVLTSITASESTGHFVRNDQGVWTKTVTLQWPAAKSHSRWAIGETIQSELVSVRFFVRVKVSVSSPNGTESIELSEKELLIVSTNEVERKEAVSKYNELLLNQVERSGRSRSKSKSPRRSKREMDLDLPPPPAPFEGTSKQNGTVRDPTHGPSSSVKARRPHTSAGPRDSRPFDFAGAQERIAYRRGDDSKDAEAENVFQRRREDNPGPTLQKKQSRPETSQGLSSKRRSGMGMGSLFSSAPKMTAALSVSSNGSNGSRNGSSVSSSGLDAGPRDKMREWEEELAKIERQSRKSSDLLWGFVRKRSAPKTQGRPTF